LRKNFSRYETTERPRMWSDSQGWASAMDFCEHINEHQGYKKGEKFLHQIDNINFSQKILINENCLVHCVNLLKLDTYFIMTTVFIKFQSFHTITKQNFIKEEIKRRLNRR
jgi:hypothetical protein